MLMRIAINLLGIITRKIISILYSDNWFDFNVIENIWSLLKWRVSSCLIVGSLRFYFEDKNSRCVCQIDKENVRAGTI